MFSCVIVYHITNALSRGKSENVKKIILENDSAARKGGRHAKTVSERGRQPRSLTDYFSRFRAVGILV
jgi:hypothetical protein